MKAVETDNRAKEDSAISKEQLSEYERRFYNASTAFGDKIISGAWILGAFILAASLASPFSAMFLDAFSTKALKASLELSNTSTTKLASDQANEINNLKDQLADLKRTQENSKSEIRELTERVKTIEESVPQQESPAVKNISSGTESVSATRQELPAPKNTTPKAKTSKIRK